MSRAGRLRHLASLLRPYRARVMVMFVALLLATAAALAPPYLAGRAIDDGIRDQNMQALTVITRNHLYELFVISGPEGRVRVRGGNFFPEWREATLAGCSLGGSFLKLRGVYAGFCMELYVDGESIITSPVQKLTLSAVDESHRH